MTKLVLCRGLSLVVITVLDCPGPSCGVVGVPELVRVACRVPLESNITLHGTCCCVCWTSKSLDDTAKTKLVLLLLLVSISNTQQQVSCVVVVVVLVGT